jgi:hypothetical protein
MTDLNALFNHPRIDILGMIESAIEAGVIYNADFTELKNAANRKLEAGYHAAVVEPYLAVDYDVRNAYPQGINDLYYSAYPQIHTLNARDKTITKLEKEHGDHWMVKAAREYLELVRPVIVDLNKVKALVVKGRKPSDQPRKTPERTLENTGTCAICGRNVKLNSNGKIVDHGYTIRYGFQQGNCFGVGWAPIEVSSAGAAAYVKALETFKARQEESLPKAIEAAEALALKQKSFEDTREERAVRHAPSNIESQIRYLGRDIEAYTKIVDQWEAKPLPTA